MLHNQEQKLSLSEMNEDFRTPVRHKQCSVLLYKFDGNRCTTCSSYRSSLNRAVTRKERESTEPVPHIHTNNRYLSSPAKNAKLHKLQQKNRSYQKLITRLKEKLADVTSKDGVSLGDDMDSDLKEIIVQEDEGIREKHPEGSFL